MKTLKEVWWNKHLNTYSKYLLFCAIPMNLLLWGCKTWLLWQSLLDKLEVFLHWSIQCILAINITRVKEEKIQNTTIQNIFYNIPDVEHMIAAWQLDFIGKAIRGPHDQPLRCMIKVCCNHHQQVGCPQTHTKTPWYKIYNSSLLESPLPPLIALACSELDQWGIWQEILDCSCQLTAPPWCPPPWATNRMGTNNTL